MSEKAFEYKIGYWFEDPIFVDTFTLKDDTDLKKLNLEILGIVAMHLKLDETVESKGLRTNPK